MNHRPRLGRSRAAPPIDVNMPGSAEEIGWTLVGTTRRATDLVSVLKFWLCEASFVPES
jgi:hypothetical protein